MNWVKRNELAVYLLLAFGLSWWTWPLTLLNPESTAMIPFGPILAAFIVTALTRGRAGIKALLQSIGRWRVHFKWYAAALLLPLAMILASIYLNVLFGAPAPSTAAYANIYTLLPAFLATTLLAGPLAEEPGWRGFLLPRLQRKYSTLVASLITGLIWFSWHMPLLLTNDSGGQRPPIQFLISILGMSIIYSWLYNETNRSLFLAILMHGAYNTLGSYFFPIQAGDAYLRLWWIHSLLWLVAASGVVFATAMHRSHSAPEPQATAA